MKKKTCPGFFLEQARKKTLGKGWLLGMTVCTYGVLSSMVAKAQNGEAGIQAATDQVAGYFDTGCDLVYAICAVVGLIGAVKVLCAMNVLAA